MLSLLLLPQPQPLRCLCLSQPPGGSSHLQAPMQELGHFSSEIVCKKEILHLLLLQSLTASLPAALHFAFLTAKLFPTPAVLQGGLCSGQPVVVPL